MDRGFLLLLIGVALAAYAAGYITGAQRTEAAWRAAQPPTEYDFRIQPP